MARPAGVNKARVGLLTSTHVVDDFYQGAVPAMLPFFVAERHYSYAAVTGITLAATFLSSMIQPVFGLVTDRHRFRWLVGSGLLVAGLGISASGLVDNYAFTWLVVAIGGIGVAAYHPEAFRQARVAAGASAQGMSWFSVGGNVGVALAPITVAPVLEVTTLRGSAVLAVPAVAMAVFLGALLVHQRREEPVAPAPKKKTAAPGARDDWSSFRWLLGVIIARSITYYGIVSFLALYLIHHFGVSKGIGSAALTTYTGTGACATVLGGWLADRIGRVVTVRIGYAIALPGLAGLILAPNLAVAFVSAAVIGLGTFLQFSIHTTLGQEYLPNRIGTASGMTTGFSVTVGGAFSPLFGLFADANGIVPTLVTLFVFPIAALLLSLRLRDRPPHQLADTAAEPAGSHSG